VKKSSDFPLKITSGHHH